MCCQNINRYQTTNGNYNCEYTTLPYGYGRCSCTRTDDYYVSGYFQGMISVEKKGGCPCQNKPNYVPVIIANPSGCGGYNQGYGQGINLGCGQNMMPSCNQNFSQGMASTSMCPFMPKQHSCSLFNACCLMKLFM